MLNPTCPEILGQKNVNEGLIAAIIERLVLN
jgi:hypothetical protein